LCPRLSAYAAAAAAAAAVKHVLAADACRICCTEKTPRFVGNLTGNRFVGNLTGKNLTVLSCNLAPHSCNLDPHLSRDKSGDKILKILQGNKERRKRGARAREYTRGARV
jgi:predicted RNase H-like nuclease